MSTQTDSELRKQLFIELDNFYRFGSNDDSDISTAINRILPIIEANRRKSVVEKLSEINSVTPILDKPDRPDMYYFDRGYELVAVLDQLSRPNTNSERSEV